VVFDRSPITLCINCSFRPHRIYSCCYTRSSVHGRLMSVCLCVSVGHVRKPRKTDEPIEMPLGVMTRVGHGYHVLDGGLDPTRKRGFFGGRGAGDPL